MLTHSRSSYKVDIRTPLTLQVGPHEVANPMTQKWQGCRVSGQVLYFHGTEQARLWTGFCTVEGGGYRFHSQSYSRLCAGAISCYSSVVFLSLCETHCTSTMTTNRRTNSKSFPHPSPTPVPPSSKEDIGDDVEVIEVQLPAPTSAYPVVPFEHTVGAHANAAAAAHVLANHINGLSVSSRRQLGIILKKR